MEKQSLFWLSDAAWAALAPHLPYGKPGKPRVDDRRVISGILHVLKVGCRWRDVPVEYGPAKTIYNRYHRWSQRRIWHHIFEKMTALGPVPDELSIDSTHGQGTPLSPTLKRRGGVGTSDWHVARWKNKQNSLPGR